MKRQDSNNFTKNVNMYSLILTFWGLGVFLHFDYVCIISKTITSVIECFCLTLACILLMYKGCNLKKIGILGVKEMAFGATQLYIMTHFLLAESYYESILWFVSTGYYLFNFIGGFITFIYSLIEKWSTNTSSNSLTKTESFVVIITSIFVTIFAGIQLFV